MSFLDELRKQKQKLKETDTIVTNAAGDRHLLRGDSRRPMTMTPAEYGFIVDTDPDDTPSLISECVYIGSQDCATEGVLQKYNIKRVLSVGIDVDVKDVDHKFVECLDLPETNIEPVLNECVPFVLRAVSCGENVLIHCNAGVSRAAAVAIAYLMRCGSTFDEAYSAVKEKRPAIQPNAGFRDQLKRLGI